LTLPARERDKRDLFLIPLFSPHIKDFQTYQLGRVWQYSLVPVTDQRLRQAEHGWWSFGDSGLALLVHVLSLPSILLGQHQDLVLAHYPEIEFMKYKKSVYSKVQQIWTFLVWRSLAGGMSACSKERKQSRRKADLKNKLCTSDQCK